MPELSLPVGVRGEEAVKRAKKKLRLAYELATLQGAVLGAWLLAEALHTDQLGQDSHVSHGPRALAGILALVEGRLMLVGAALRGVAPGRLLWGLHNYATSEEPPAAPEQLLDADPES